MSVTAEVIFLVMNVLPLAIAAPGFWGVSVKGRISLFLGGVESFVSLGELLWRLGVKWMAPVSLGDRVERRAREEEEIDLVAPLPGRRGSVDGRGGGRGRGRRLSVASVRSAGSARS
jgi:hypothetical protein